MIHIKFQYYFWILAENENNKILLKASSVNGMKYTKNFDDENI